jgi:hypothetical protein
VSPDGELGGSDDEKGAHREFTSRPTAVVARAVRDENRDEDESRHATFRTLRSIRPKRARMPAKPTLWEAPS